MIFEDSLDKAIFAFMTLLRPNKLKKQALLKKWSLQESNQGHLGHETMEDHQDIFKRLNWAYYRFVIDARPT